MDLQEVSVSIQSDHKANRRNPRIGSAKFSILSDNDEIDETASDWMDYSEDLSYRRPYKPISLRNRKLPRRLRPSPLEDWHGKGNTSMLNSVAPAIRHSLRVAATGKPNTTDNRYKATLEQAMDPKTHMVLFKMLKRGIFDDINGCIYTGKQGNVYHATKRDGQEFAVKVYKTPVLDFKGGDHHRMQGDYRFRHGCRKHNPEKMAKTRAENDMIKLTRLKAAGIKCPTPIHLRLHVLVMKFIGKSGWSAPCLKDANLSEDKMRECYVQMIMVMRNLYQKCKLVHVDLSEYNILYYEGNLHIIDVSQSVDLDHPYALNFLREDCRHVSDYFKKNGVGVMTMWELYDFIVDSSITDESVECYLEEAQRKILARGELLSAEDKMLMLDQLKDTEEEEDATDFTFIITTFEDSLIPAEMQLGALTHELTIGEIKTTDKRDCKSAEQAIDPSTRMVLLKMLNHAIFDDIEGCISYGKQVDVYHVTKNSGEEFAVKVYKPPVLEFEDRDHDIKGDYPDKMVKTLAENEMRNLTRLKAAGIRCPTPIHLNRHVLVMGFIGKSGRPAPRLKDANLSEDKMCESYVQMIMVMRNLYQKCKLVHGDLSENNILYYEGNLHIIDVPQSVDVDLDHPLALKLLREDCIHVSDFFKKNGVLVMPIQELFDFIVDSSITDESVGFYLEKVQQKILDRGEGCPSSKELDTNGPSTDRTDNFGTEFETDENDKEVNNHVSSDSKE